MHKIDNYEPLLCLWGSWIYGGKYKFKKKRIIVGKALLYWTCLRNLLFRLPKEINHGPIFNNGRVSGCFLAVWPSNNEGRTIISGYINISVFYFLLFIYHAEWFISAIYGSIQFYLIRYLLRFAYTNDNKFILNKFQSEGTKINIWRRMG